MRVLFSLILAGVCSRLGLAVPVIPAIWTARGMTGIHYNDVLAGGKYMGRPAVIEVILHTAEPTTNLVRSMANLASKTAEYGAHYVISALQGKLPEIERSAARELKKLRHEATPVIKETAHPQNPEGSIK